MHGMVSKKDLAVYSCTIYDHSEKQFFVKFISKETSSEEKELKIIDENFASLTASDCYENLKSSAGILANTESSSSRVRYNKYKLDEYFSNLILAIFKSNSTKKEVIVLLESVLKLIFIKRDLLKLENIFSYVIQNLKICKLPNETVHLRIASFASYLFKENFLFFKSNN